MEREANVVSLFALYLLLSCANGGSDMVRLYDYLMSDYAQEIRPIKNHSLPLNVTFGFALTQIIDMDERNQILTTSAWLNHHWMDINLAWKPQDFGNITMIHFPHQKLWKPDIVLYNNADPGYASAGMNTDIFVLHTGNVTWLSAVIFRSSCRLDVRYYPFDEQVCSLKFASWAYDGTLIDLDLVSEEGDDSNYMKSSEWDLLYIQAKKHVNYFSCCSQPFPDITINMRISRRPMFYVFNLLLPCVLISFIALFAFYMPSDSGEKVTLGVTAMLSMTVFMMIVAESMPPTSDVQPLIAIYYGVMTTIISLTTALTVLTVNLHFKGVHGHPVSPCLRHVVFGIMAPCLRLRLHRASSTENVIENKLFKRSLGKGSHSPWKVLGVTVSGGRHVEWRPTVNFSGRSDLESAFQRVLSRIEAAIRRSEDRLDEEDEVDRIKHEWQQIAQIIDRFLLVCFLILTVGTTLLILLYRRS